MHVKTNGGIAVTNCCVVTVKLGERADNLEDSEFEFRISEAIGVRGWERNSLLQASKRGTMAKPDESSSE